MSLTGEKIRLREAFLLLTEACRAAILLQNACCTVQEQEASVTFCSSKNFNSEEGKKD